MVINADKLGRFRTLVGPTYKVILFFPTGLLPPVVPLAAESLALDHLAHDEGTQHPVLGVLQPHVLPPLGAVPGPPTPGVRRPETRGAFD